VLRDAIVHTLPHMPLPQVLALVSAALIEMYRYRVVRQSGLLERFLAAGPEADPLDPLFTQPMR
jgi:hypothetical protein